jgi:hypothetical protein
MATFPTLVPSGRSYTPGEYPHTAFDPYSGFQNRVRHSNVMLSSSLRLRFTALSEANMLSILSHYQGQLGGFESFDLPTSIWSGVGAVIDYQLDNYRWRYTEPPSVEDVYCGRHNVELALETVPPDGVVVNGFEITVTFALGVADMINARPSISFSIQGGTATGA